MKKFTDVLVRALIKPHVEEPHVGRSNGRLKKCHATARLILCCLRWNSKSFRFNALWCHTIQWRHMDCVRLIRVRKKHTFNYCM